MKDLEKENEDNSFKKEYFLNLKNKTIRIAKKMNTGYVFYYYGEIIKVMEDSLCFFDHKTQKDFLLSFDELSVLKIDDIQT